MEARAHDARALPWLLWLLSAKIIVMTYTVRADGLLRGVRWAPSPNRDARPPGAAIEALIVHAISLPPGQFGGADIEQLFLNTLDQTRHPSYAGLVGLNVSSHLLIRRDGEIVQFVPFIERAWHAGSSRCCGRSRVNDFSVGIELEGTDYGPFTARQYTALADVTRALVRVYPIAFDRIFGHSDIAPGRKTDPGPYFDWPLYVALCRGAQALARRAQLPVE